MVWLPDGEKISKISLFVLTKLTNVTDTQTPHDGIDRTYASHRAAKTPASTPLTEWKARLIGRGVRNRLIATH